jgi:hypothetical protein
MGRYSTRSIVALALVLFAEIALADQGAPVYVSQDPNNPPSGSCVGNRIQIDNETGQIYACVALSWTKVGNLSSGTAIQKGNGSGGFMAAVSGTDYAPATTGVANGTVLRANGSGAFSAMAATTCTNQVVEDISVAGAGTCVTLTDAYISGLSAGKLSFADSTTYSFGKATPTAVVLNVGHNGTAALASTFNIADHAHSAVAGKGGQIAYSSLTGTPTIPADVSGQSFLTFAAAPGLSAERVLTADNGIALDIATAGLAKVKVSGAIIGRDVTGDVQRGSAVRLFSATPATIAGGAVSSDAITLSGSYWNTTVSADAPGVSIYGYAVSQGGATSIYSSHLALGPAGVPASAYLDVSPSGMVLRGDLDIRRDPGSLASAGAPFKGSEPLTLYGELWSGTVSDPHGWELYAAFTAASVAAGELQFNFKGLTGDGTKVKFTQTGNVVATGALEGAAAKLTPTAAALPTCDATARGTFYVSQPATGADEVRWCLRNSDGTTFSWVTAVLGGS